MPEGLTVSIDGRALCVPAGTTVAAAILIAGESSFRHSVSGERRGPLCGMGICFECRVTIDGRPHCRSCQIECHAGMDITTA